MKKGFTLAEVLTTLTVMGILLALTIPSIKNILPDNDKIRFKKAYQTTDIIVEQLKHDDILYPEENLGFADISRVCIGGNDSSGECIGGEVYKGESKFSKAFMSKLNVKTIITNNNTEGVHFVTNDGIAWNVRTHNDGCVGCHFIRIMPTGWREGQVGYEGSQDNVVALKIYDNGRIEIYDNPNHPCNDERKNWAKCKAFDWIKSTNMKKGE